MRVTDAYLHLIRRAFVVLLVMASIFVCAFSCCGSGRIMPYASETADADYAAKLSQMGLLSDPQNNDPLDRKIGITMVLKLMGYDQAAVNSGVYGEAGRFSDVPKWFSGYADLAYELNIANGTATGRFSPNSPLSEKQLVCFLLRALGYDVESSWKDADGIAKRIGLIRGDYTLGNAQIRKKEAAEFIFKAMSKKSADSSQYLGMSLINKGAISERDAISSGLLEQVSGNLEFTSIAKDPHAGIVPVINDKNVNSQGAGKSFDDLKKEYNIYGDELSADEKKLAKLVNDYRMSLGLPALKISKSLTKVARYHVLDSNVNSPENQIAANGEKGSLHSWSDKGEGLWKPVIYTKDHKYSWLMWSKPRELSDYEGDGYEISCWKRTGMTPALALKLWKTSPTHHSLIISDGVWKDLTCMGVSIRNKYAHIWFGEAADPAGYYSY